MAAGDLTTLANVRRYLRGDFSDPTYTTFDAEISRLITAISADVRRQTDRRLDVPAATITERHHGSDAGGIPPQREGNAAGYSGGYGGGYRSGYLAGLGGTRLMLAEYPVVSITSLTIDGVQIPAQVGGAGEGYFLETRGLDGPTIIELIGYGFSSGRGTISAVYTAGWQTVPSDLEQAVIQLVALAFTDADHVGVSSKTVNGDTANFNGGPQLANAGAIIDRYTRVSVG